MSRTTIQSPTLARVEIEIMFELYQIALTTFQFFRILFDFFRQHDWVFFEIMSHALHLEFMFKKTRLEWIRLEKTQNLN